MKKEYLAGRIPKLHMRLLILKNPHFTNLGIGDKTTEIGETKVTYILGSHGKGIQIIRITRGPQQALGVGDYLAAALLRLGRKARIFDLMKIYHRRWIFHPIKRHSHQKIPHLAP